MHVRPAPPLRRWSVVAFALGLLSIAGCSAADPEQAGPRTASPPATVRAANPLYRQVIPASTPSIPVELYATGLAPLGDEANYELWIVLDGRPMSGGRFDVTEAGEIWDDESVDGRAELRADLDASAMMVTIESSVRDHPSPSAIHVLGGDVPPDGSIVLRPEPAFAESSYSSQDQEELSEEMKVMVMLDAKSEG